MGSRATGRRRTATFSGAVLLLCIINIIYLQLQASTTTSNISRTDVSITEAAIPALIVKDPALVARSLTVSAINSYMDGQEVVPAHFLAVLNEQGDCLLPGKNYCTKFRNAQIDLHVDQSIMTVLRGRCTPTMHVWDFGGCVGYYTLFMRAMDCHVTTVEPQPSMNKFHKDSLGANGWDKDGSVVLHEKGVSDVAGTIKLFKLWQPGNGNAGQMEVETVTIAELAKDVPGGVVEMLKLDIDGPELFTLRGILACGESLNVMNIIAELSVSYWPKFGFERDTILDLFNKYFEAGYRMVLVMESEFPKYPAATLLKLREVRNYGELVHGYDIPRALIGEVLYMANSVTKNLFMTKDPAFIAKLDACIDE
mmetsp:Transcript_27848/g.50361  ORF Transcript_27848/g.50361 Transcript_27848/m.50361 type:complete len:367 (+) Transcript_27848:42-1142(+)